VALDSEDRRALILALDQGGHASRAVLYDSSGCVVSEAQVPVATRRRGDVRIEHDADELVASLQQAATDASRGTRAAGGKIAAAGLATQRSTVVCWDADTSKALSPAISWQDRRGQALIDQMNGSESWIRGISGLVLSPHYGASKLRWSLDNIAAVQNARARGTLRAGPLSAFLLNRLLRERPNLVDPANAARTQLFDPAVCNWSPRLLEAFGVPAEILPRCVPTRHGFGTLAIDKTNVALLACTGDQAAAAFGFGQPVEATAYLNAGTGAFLQRLSSADAMVPPGLLRSVLCSTNSEVQYSLEGTVNGAGSAVDWLQDRVALDTARALQTLSRQPGIETPLLMNGVGGLGSPYWQPRFATEFIGTGSEMSQLQAVVESIVFLIRVNLDLMKKAGPLSRIVVTGGFARCNYFCDALAGLSGMAVERYALPEATARGVAFLAAGLPRQWHSVSLERRFTPSPHSGLHARFAKWQQAMHERDAWSP